MTELLALVGPTASGKTAIATALAQRFDAEIIAADSMTIYRGMDIGTAKPQPADQAAVPHHMIDIAEPFERFSVARFQRLARDAIDGIRARGKRPFVVGGSGLYFRAVVDDLSFPPSDLAVRARIEREDPAVLVARLKELDPEAAAFIDPSNVRRVVRALEVIEITGRPFSSFRGAWERYGDVIAAGLMVPAEILDRRIEDRLRAMLASGFIDEVRALCAAGYSNAITASKAVGYRQAIDLLEGSIDEDGFVELAARATRKLARRQMSWFRADPRIAWFDATDPEHAAAEVGAYYASSL